MKHAFKRLFSGMLLATTAFLAGNTTVAQTIKSKHMKKKILFVVTSHDKKRKYGRAYRILPVGSYPSWEVLRDAGYEIEFVSPKGGNAPVDGMDLKDVVNAAFWNNEQERYKVEHTKKPEAVNPDDYAAIHYAGGHGAMWDLADNKALADIAAKIYEHGGVVSAVCHGPAGLVNIKLSNGQYLVKDKKVNGFTNEEEIAVKLDKVVPFSLEDKLKERGARFEKIRFMANPCSDGPTPGDRPEPAIGQGCGRGTACGTE